jgi:spermidine synthase
MKLSLNSLGLVLAAALPACSVTGADLVYEVTSPYHNIRVVDDNGQRTLCFDDAWESRMSLQDPLKGHFEYTEYFHMVWLWNGQITNVLMVGLGGGTAQRAFEHYYRGVTVETVEIDPMVAKVARNYFSFKDSARQKVQIADGRVALRRSTAHYDAIILDAYLSGRYGSSIPQHLATREFFLLARDHLTSDGVLAYNVMGTLSDWHAGLVGAIYRTLKTVFPQVYLFPAQSSQNVVLVAARSPAKTTLETLRQRADSLVQSGRVTVPGFRQRVEVFQAQAPASAAHSPVLTDDYAPVEGLAAGGL